MPGMGVATATVILVAHGLGQKNTKDIKQLVRDSYLISMIMMLCVGALVYVFGSHLTYLFTTNQTALAASLVVLFLFFCRWSSNSRYTYLHSSVARFR